MVGWWGSGTNQFHLFQWLPFLQFLGHVCHLAVSHSFHFVAGTCSWMNTHLWSQVLPSEEVISAPHPTVSNTTLAHYPWHISWFRDCKDLDCISRTSDMRHQILRLPDLLAVCRCRRNHQPLPSMFEEQSTFGLCNRIHQLAASSILV